MEYMVEQLANNNITVGDKTYKQGHAVKRSQMDKLRELAHTLFV